MKRPWYLTVVLILIALGALFSLYSYTLGTSMITIAMPNLPSWYLMALAVASVGELVGVYLIWQWKLMGFYLFVAIAVIVAILNMMYLGAGSILFGVIGVVILYLVMRPVWKNFK